MVGKMQIEARRSTSVPPVKAKLYGILIIAIGTGLLVEHLPHWHPYEMGRYLCYLLLAAASSRLRVSLPSLTGGMPLFYVLVLFSVVEFNLPETLMLGCLAALLQCLTNRVERTLGRILFGVANMALAIAVTYATYHSTPLYQRNLETDSAVDAHRGRVLRDEHLLRVRGNFTHRTKIAAANVAGMVLLVVPVLSAGGCHGRRAVTIHNHIWLANRLLAIPVIYLRYRSYAMYLVRNEDGRKHAEEMAALHLRTIEALALAIEAKDHITHDHSAASRSTRSRSARIWP